MREKKQRTVMVINVHEDDVLCFRKEVILALEKEGYNLVLLYPLGDRCSEIESEHIKCVDIKIDRHGINPFKDFKLFISYLQALKKFKPDVVLLYTIKPNIYASVAAQICHIPVVNNITGIGGSLHEKKSFLQRFIESLYRFALRKSSHIFFQNKENRDYFEKKKLCDINKTSVIPGSGVDLKRFDFSLKGQSDGTIVFNFIGRVMEKKGILDYLEMAERVKKIYPFCEFNILGFFENDESNMKTVVEEAQKRGTVIYRGNQADVKPWIVRSDAIVLPSKYGEGMSNVLLESAAIGRALITSNIPGCRDLVCKDNGYVFEPGDVDGLTDCVLDFIRLPMKEKEAMGFNSRKIVEQSFSREIVVNSYLDLLKSLFDEEQK